MNKYKNKKYLIIKKLAHFMHNNPSIINKVSYHQIHNIMIIRA